jgi:hypothetical protein
MQNAQCALRVLKCLIVKQLDCARIRMPAKFRYAYANPLLIWPCSQRIISVDIWSGFDTVIGSAELVIVTAIT